MVWTLCALPSLWRMASANGVAARIIADNRFKSGALVGVLKEIEPERDAALVQASLLRAKAIVQLRLAEEAMARKSSDEADGSASVALMDIRAALAVEPNDAFLWLMHYSVQTVRNGVDREFIRYLDQSYAVGPHEGWIALRRNRVALGAFPTLSKATQSKVISEFEEMVDSDFIEDAESNLTGVGWIYREQLVAALSSADIISRQSLYKRLAADGVKLSIPGVVDERPWR